MTSRSIRSAASSWALSRSYLVCRFIQNSGEVPKYRARRKAVSAVIDRFPWMMVVIRLAGTLSRSARALAEMPDSFRISVRCSPGWIGASFLVRMVLSPVSMIIDHFDIVGVSLSPLEADPVLIVDPDAVLALAVAGQLFKMMSRNPQIGQRRGGVQPVKPHAVCSLDCGEPGYLFSCRTPWRRPFSRSRIHNLPQN